MPLLILLPLAGLVLFGQRRLDVPVSLAALLTVSAVMVFLYLCAFAGLLPGARLVVLGLGAAALMFECLKYRSHARGNLASVPMVIFLLLALGFYLLHGNSHFHYYDEYSHWGIFLREMSAAGGFWGADSNSLHPRYPPGPTLWQYLFSFGPLPKDGDAYLAQFVLLVTPLLVLFEGLNWRRGLWVPAILVPILAGLSLFGHGIASLYVDHVMATWVAGILLAFMALPRIDARSMALFALPLAALALIKDVGFFFALSLAAVMVVVGHLRNRGERNEVKRTPVPRAALAILLIVGAPLLVTASWSHNRDAVGAPEDVMSVGGLVGIVTGQTRVADPERAALVRERFATVFLHQQLAKNEVSARFNEFSFDTMALYDQRFRLTTAVFLLLYVVGSLLLLRFVVPDRQRVVWAIALAGLLAMAIGYLLMLYLSYQYVFPKRDALRVASYLRYAHSVVLAMLLLVLAPLLPGFADRNAGTGTSRSRTRFSGNAVAFGLVVLALVVVERPWLTPLYRTVPMPDFRADIQPFTREVRRIAGDAPLWVYFPDPNPHNVLSRVVLFELSPTPVTLEADAGFFAQSEEDILAAWKGHGHVWLMARDASIDQRLIELAGAVSPVGLFEIRMGPGGPRLAPLDPRTN